MHVCERVGRHVLISVIVVYACCMGLSAHMFKNTVYFLVYVQTTSTIPVDGEVGLCLKFLVSAKENDNREAFVSENTLMYVHAFSDGERRK